MARGLIDLLLDNIFDAEWAGRRGEKLTERELMQAIVFMAAQIFRRADMYAI